MNEFERYEWIANIQPLHRTQRMLNRLAALPRTIRNYPREKLESPIVKQFLQGWIAKVQTRVCPIATTELVTSTLFGQLATMLAQIGRAELKLGLDRSITPFLRHVLSNDQYEQVALKLAHLYLRLLQPLMETEPLIKPLANMREYCLRMTRLYYAIKIEGAFASPDDPLGDMKPSLQVEPSGFTKDEAPLLWLDEELPVGSSLSTLYGSLPIWRCFDEQAQAKLTKEFGLRHLQTFQSKKLYAIGVDTDCNELPEGALREDFDGWQFMADSLWYFVAPTEMGPKVSF